MVSAVPLKACSKERSLKLGGDLLPGDKLPQVSWSWEAPWTCSLKDHSSFIFQNRAQEDHITAHRM